MLVHVCVSASVHVAHALRAAETIFHMSKYSHKPHPSNAERGGSLPAISAYISPSLGTVWDNGKAERIVVTNI